MVISSAIKTRTPRILEPLIPKNTESSLWDQVKRRISEYEVSGRIAFESDRYEVLITRGSYRDEGKHYLISTYRVSLKSTGASWVVPRLGTCVENLVCLADSEIDGRMSIGIENLLQELAEDISEVVTIGDGAPGWCRSRADVVDMFKLVAPGNEVVFPLTAGNRPPIDYD